MLGLQCAPPDTALIDLDSFVTDTSSEAFLDAKPDPAVITGSQLACIPLYICPGERQSTEHRFNSIGQRSSQPQLQHHEPAPRFPLGYEEPDPELPIPTGRLSLIHI